VPIGMVTGMNHSKKGPGKTVIKKKSGQLGKFTERKAIKNRVYFTVDFRYNKRSDITHLQLSVPCEQYDKNFKTLEKIGGFLVCFRKRGGQA